MTEQEAQTLLMQGAAIDQGAAAAMDEATGGVLDGRGGIVPANENDGAEDWIIIPEMLAMLITHVLPETAPVYTVDKQMTLAGKIAAVGKKYGWDGPSSPEMSLVIASIGFGAPAYIAWQQRKELAAKEAEAPKAAGGGDGS